MRSNARRLFENEQDPRGAFANAYEAKFGEGSVEEANKIWEDRGLAFKQTLQKTDPTQEELAMLGKALDSNRDGTLDQTELKRLGAIIDAAIQFDGSGATYNNYVERSTAENEHTDKVLKNADAVKDAYETFQKNGVSGSKTEAAPPVVPPAKNQPINPRTVAVYTPRGS